MSEVAVCTIVTRSYLPFARVLERSLTGHHPELSLHVHVIDEGEPSLTRDELFGLSLGQALVVPKPRLMRTLLDEGASGVLYLDADVLVLGRLDPLLDAMAEGSPVLTPHLVEPLDGPDRVERDLGILTSGVYNAGVVGAPGNSAGRAFLNEWAVRVEGHSEGDITRGVWFDQRWLDLAPGQHPELRVLRDPTINAGHWALPERSLEGCRLFHFSGFDPAHPDRVTTHADRLGRAPALFTLYAELVEGAGLAEAMGEPYAYGEFDDGVPIPDGARSMWRGLDDDERARFGDPFAVGRKSFRRWLLEPVGGDLNRLLDSLYESDPSVQMRFPDHRGRDRDDFVTWAADEGGIDPALLKTKRRSLI